jgi:hypothetical protein
VSDDVPILHLDGDPILVKPGPLTDDTRARIERAVSLAIPPGKQLAVVAVLDGSSGKPITGTAGVAWKIAGSDHWKLAAEVSARWDGPVRGQVGIVGVF